MIVGSPGGISPRLGGIALTALGQIYYTTVKAATDVYVNGFRVTGEGALVCTPGGAIADFLEGIPRAGDGSMVIQVNVAPAATDPFLGGLRIGALGGVYTNSTAPVSTEVPINTVLPHVSGVTTVGSVLTCTTGTWINTPTAYVYAWYRSGVLIAGATLSTYTAVTADLNSTVLCTVTASNTAGGNTAASNGVRIGGASYNYVTTSNQFPPSGALHAVNGAQILWFNEIDANGINWVSVLSQLVVGDKVTIGATTVTLTNSAGVSGSVWVLPISANWTAPANATYTVTVQKA